MKRMLVTFLLLLPFSACMEEKNPAKVDKFILREVDPDTLTADELFKFIKMEIDSFDNDTSYTIEVLSDQKNHKNKSQFLSLDFSYNAKGTSESAFVSFVANHEYTLREGSESNISFKVEDSIIVNPFTDGINSNSIVWPILYPSDITNLKKLSARRKILVRIAGSSDSDMLLTKEQLNGFTIFTKFIENKGYFNRITNRM